MYIYEKIKQRRKELNLSQDELAKKLGYTSRSTIAKIESGKIDISQSRIVAFANALGVTPGYLMGWENLSENKNTRTKSNELIDTEEELKKIEKMLEEQEALMMHGSPLNQNDKVLFLKAARTNIETAIKLLKMDSEKNKK